jgi:cytoskeleton protein RodZ
VGSFGDKLKRERELRGVTLEEIAKATKIGTRALQALEDEHFEQLPGGIFNKGFVRAYAKFLGLDEEQMVADFMSAQGDHNAQKPDLMASLAVKAEAQRRSEIAASGGGGGSTSTWVTLAILILLTAGAAAGVRYYKMKKQAAAEAKRARVETPAPQPVAPPPTVTDTSLTAAPMNSATADPSQQPAAATAAPVGPTQGSTNTTAVPGSTAAPLKSAVPSNSTATSTPAAAASPGVTTAKGPLELQIHVSKATWVSVQADGKPAVTETLRDSATKTVDAQDRIVLTTGNSVDVTCNGKPLGIMGTDNQRSQVKITAGCKVN